MKARELIAWSSAAILAILLIVTGKILMDQDKTITLFAELVESWETTPVILNHNLTTGDILIYSPHSAKPFLFKHICPPQRTL